MDQFIFAMVPNPILNAVSKDLNTKITGFNFLSGGCINEGGKLYTTKGDFFIKWNSKTQFEQMFEKEQWGIESLQKTSSLPVPKVIATGVAEEWQYLILEFIEPGTRSGLFWKKLGEQLAQLHRLTDAQFGLAYDNYIGSLVQHNAIHSSWPSFFEHQRLRPLIKTLELERRIDKTLLHSFDKLYPRLSEIFPDEQPALLHGDLWSGNVICNNKGMAVVIDPAIYYGHREAELAFTKLFGGFESAFYESYAHHFPLEQGFQQRMGIYNLYPLLVHTILFGDSYLEQVKRIIKHFN